MAINRFSRGPIAADVQSNFIPLPLDFLAGQMEAKQERFDTTKAFIEGLDEELYKAKALTPDVEELRGIVGGYEDELEKAIDSVGGDYGKLTGIADNIGRRIAKDMHSGKMGGIHSNYLLAQAHKEDLDKRFDNDKISEEGYARGLASIQQFGGTKELAEGIYSKASFYTPGAKLDIGTTADNYGKVIREHHTYGKGNRFNYNRVVDIIRKNLMSNSDVIRNAKDILWAQYGELNPNVENAMVQEYLNQQAKQSADKFMRQEKAPETGTNELTAGITRQVELPIKAPYYTKLDQGMAGSITKQLRKLKNIRKVGGLKRFFQTGQLNFNEEQINAEVNAQATKIGNDINNNALMRDIAVSKGFNFADGATEEELNSFLDVLDKASDPESGSSQLVVALEDSEDVHETFKRSIRGHAFTRARIIDESGQPVSVDDKLELMRRYRENGNEGSATYVYGHDFDLTGVVSKYDFRQDLPPNSQVFMTHGLSDHDSDDPTKTYIILPSNLTPSEQANYEFYLKKNVGTMPAGSMKQSYSGGQEIYYHEGKGMVAIYSADGKRLLSRVDTSKMQLPPTR